MSSGDVLEKAEDWTEPKNEFVKFFRQQDSVSSERCSKNALLSFQMSMCECRAD